MAWIPSIECNPTKSAKVNGLKNTPIGIPRYGEKRSVSSSPGFWAKLRSRKSSSTKNAWTMGKKVRNVIVTMNAAMSGSTGMLWRWYFSLDSIIEIEIVLNWLVADFGHLLFAKTGNIVWIYETNYSFPSMGSKFSKNFRHRFCLVTPPLLFQQFLCRITKAGEAFVPFGKIR